MKAAKLMSRTAILIVLPCSRGIMGGEKQSETLVAELPEQELLALARKALGGEAKLNTIETLSATGKLRRVMGEMDQSGEIEFTFALPDRFRKEETVSTPMGPEVMLVAVLNANQAWRDIKALGGGNLMMSTRHLRGDHGSEAKQLEEMQGEFQRLLVSTLLILPPASSLQFIGESESNDGRADVIDVKGDDGFAARLFLDQKTHLPLMLSYRGVLPRMVFSRMGLRPLGGDREKMRMEMDERRKKIEAEGPPPLEEADFELHYSDYRVVDGVQLPHVVTRAVNGETKEEWQIQKYRINPSIKHN